MAPDALPSSLERGLRKVGLGKGRYEVWRCAFSPRMAVRERPEAKAQIVATLQKDQHFIADVKKAKGGTWLVFGAPELWGCRCNNRKAYVCIEGESVGHPNLGTLVERVGGDEDLALLQSHWAYTESILRVEEAGVDWHVEPCPEDSLRWFGPYRNRPLAPTHDEDGVPLAPTIPWLRRWSASGDAPDGSTPTIDALCLEAARDGPGRGRNARVEADGAYRRSGVAQYRIDEGRQQRHFRDRPRLCIAMLVRGAPASTLDSFCRYHFGVGFERIFFFFDAPDDPMARPRVRDVVRLLGRDVLEEGHVVDDVLEEVGAEDAGLGAREGHEGPRGVVVHQHQRRAADQAALALADDVVPLGVERRIRGDGGAHGAGDGGGLVVEVRQAVGEVLVELEARQHRARVGRLRQLPDRVHLAGPGPDAVHHEHGQVGADRRDEAEDAEEEGHHRNGAAFYFWFKQAVAHDY